MKPSNNKTNMKKISLFAVVVLATLLLAACSAGPKQESTATPHTLPTVAEKTTAPSIPATPPPATINSKIVPAPSPVAPNSAHPSLAKTPVQPPVARHPAFRLVSIQNFQFQPANLIISKGDTVKWLNRDSTPHIIFSDSFKSATLQMNDSFSFTFDKAGSFPYSCQIHPSMKGTVTVQP
jgi:plastocyanin